jgi:hypothetical protein
MTSIAEHLKNSGITKLGLVGPLGVGKDYVAEKLGAQVHGFADPLYQLASDLYPGLDGSDKTKPGVRALLQQLGQYGRGTVSDKYPLTAERAHFCAALRNRGPLLSVNWSEFGLNENIWVDALLRRVKLATGLVVVTNLRFENEVAALREEGFAIAGVVCSLPTLNQRQAGRTTPEAANDISERLGLDSFLGYHYPSSTRKSVDFFIWNDHTEAPKTEYPTYAA